MRFPMGMELCMLLLIQPVSQAWAVKRWWEKSNFWHRYRGGEHTSMALGAGAPQQPPSSQCTAEVVPGLSRCIPDCILLSQTNSNSLCWHLQVGSQLSSSAAVTGKVSSAWCRVLLICSCALCFVKCREEDFNFFTRQWNHPSLGKIFPAFLLSVTAWCSAAAIYLPLGSTTAGWAPSMEQMKPAHGMESCIPPFLLLSEWASHAPQQCPHGAQKAGERQTSCWSSGPACWCNPMCCDSSLLG